MTPSGQRVAKQTWGYGELTVDDVIDTAMNLTRRVGVSKFTMRLLTDELGLSPMGAYYYVPSKKVLLELVIDKVLEQIEIPSVEGEWEDRLIALLQGARHEMVKYPGLSQLVQSMKRTPSGERIAFATDDILRDAGFTNPALSLSSIALTNYPLGHVSHELARPMRERDVSSRAKAGQKRRQWVRDETMPIDDEFDFGLMSLINGLRLWLPTKRK